MVFGRLGVRYESFLVGDVANLTKNAASFRRRS